MGAREQEIRRQVLTLWDVTHRRDLGGRVWHQRGRDVAPVVRVPPHLAWKGGKGEVEVVMAVVVMRKAVLMRVMSVVVRVFVGVLMVVMALVVMVVWW